MAKNKLVPDEIKTYQFWKSVRCEFLITLLLVFMGCGSYNIWHSGTEYSDIRVALAFGFSVATLMQCVGHISGAHMNPAVTMAMLVTRNVSILRTLFYIVAQCLGGVAGAGILYGLTPNTSATHLGVTYVHPEVPLGQAFGIEFMTTFLMVFTVFANVDSKRAEMGSRALSVGLSVIIGHLLAINATGASMNPARSLGPAVIMNRWTNHWVYWVGPILGGIIGGFTYEYTHDSSQQIQHFKRSFRRKQASMKRTRSTLSTNSTISTEMAFTPTSTFDSLA
ncbi:aquaporin-4-like [Tubulanus polymorphus]|uniref:aquaporin-4-like n=1 Tax=Tubulanus polymorphus TaxID=672921 RepID=UPI003DA5F78B